MKWLCALLCAALMPFAAAADAVSEIALYGDRRRAARARRVGRVAAERIRAGVQHRAGRPWRAAPILWGSAASQVERAPWHRGWRRGLVRHGRDGARRGGGAAPLPRAGGDQR